MFASVDFRVTLHLYEIPLQVLREPWKYIPVSFKGSISFTPAKCLLSIWDIRHWDRCSRHTIAFSLQTTWQGRDFQLCFTGCSERLTHWPRGHTSKWLETYLTLWWWCFFPLRDIAFLLVLVMTIITTATTLLGASQAFRLIPSTIFSTTLCGRRYILQMIKHAVKGLKNVRGNQEAERSLDLKGISTMKQWCHRREIRKKKRKITELLN